MKDRAILLNTSRGGLLDEAAVAAALKTGKLYAAGVDVVSVEPVSEQNPLLGAENCIITPHIAWAPKDCRIRLMDMAVENLRSFLRENHQPGELTGEKQTCSPTENRELSSFAARKLPVFLCGWFQRVSQRARRPDAVCLRMEIMRRFPPSLS